MKKIAIIQSNYIPWKGYFDIINRVDTFVIYDDVQYTKNDWRNRNLIKTPTGPKWLTIPVNQTSLEQRICDTLISQKNWNNKHWKSIVNNYAKAPYFKLYKDQFEEVYANLKTSSLSEINLKLIKEINKIINIKTEIIDSKTLKLNGDKNERLIDAIKKLNGTTYLSGPTAKGYLNTDLFDKNNINVEWMSYSSYQEYPQLFPPFNHYVTILDLIFNTGPQASSYLSNDK